MPKRGKRVEFMREKGWILAIEAAKILRLHHASMYHLLDRANTCLKEHRIGAYRFVSVDSIREYLGPLADEFFEAVAS